MYVDFHFDGTIIVEKNIIIILFFYCDKVIRKINYSYYRIKNYAFEYKF